MHTVSERCFFSRGFDSIHQSMNYFDNLNEDFHKFWNYAHVYQWDFTLVTLDADGQVLLMKIYRLWLLHCNVCVFYFKGISMIEHSTLQQPRTEFYD